jgi:hypothetical protein
MASFNLEDYEQVKDRIPRFYAQFKDGRIATELANVEDGRFIVKAYIYKDAQDQEKGLALATGYAEEKLGGRGANQSSALENAETSAIGRALANYTYSGDKRPSREEMQKVAQMEKIVSEQMQTIKNIFSMSIWSEPKKVYYRERVAVAQKSTDPVASLQKVIDEAEKEIASMEEK